MAQAAEKKRAKNTQASLESVIKLVGELRPKYRDRSADIFATKEVASVKSEFQTIRIVDAPKFGKILLLDGDIQSAEKDEYIYHEASVHPALFLQPAPPKRAFIAGGGPLSTAREILKHASIEQVEMWDIDKLVTDTCLEHIPSMAAGAHKDPRLNLKHGDARKALEETKDGSWDLIVIDICDPTALTASPANHCYFESFYKTCARKLGEHGVFVTHSGSGAYLHIDSDAHALIFNTLKQVFPHVHVYETHVNSFGYPWTFCLAYSSEKVAELFALAKQNPKSVDARIEAVKFDAKLLRHYDGETHAHMFSLPKWFRAALAAEKRVLCPKTIREIGEVLLGKEEARKRLNSPLYYPKA